MSYVVTLTDIVPPPRFDGIPFTTVKVAEAELETGPWTAVIATIGLVPQDADPKHPIARSFTIPGATRQSGWYRITFEDADSNSQDTEPFYFDAFNANWIPTRYDVGALLRARTVTAGGNEIGTFDATTRPTGEQADRMVNIAISDVIEMVGDDIPSEAWSLVRSTVALRAAMHIELSYFPEQVGSGKSAYEEYKKQYFQKIKNVEKAVKQIGSGGKFGALDDAQFPFYGGFGDGVENATSMTEPW